MAKPPSPTDRIRLTITVTPETHEAFRHYADAAGISIGRAMGDWLGDQVSAVTYVALQMEQVREAPREIAQQLVPAASKPQAPRTAPAAANPPRPVIRGGNSPGRGSK